MGSPSGMWTAVSGGAAQIQNLEVISNNLANVNTPGFKKDTPTFKEYLIAIEKPTTAGVDIPRTVFKDSDFYHFDGKDSAMVNLDKVHTDHSQGSLRPTNNSLDMAIDGKGFFAVQTPNGVEYTRSGDFKINGQGFLVTTDGYPVLSAPPAEDTSTAGSNENNRSVASVNVFNPPANQPNQLKPISLKPALETGSKVIISEDGKIYSGSDEIAKLAIAEFVDSRMLEKSSQSLFKNSNPANVAVLAKASKVRQGFIEQSNVNALGELMEMIKANRLYESNMKAIKAYNDMSAKEANEVGKL